MKSSKIVSVLVVAALGLGIGVAGVGATQATTTFPASSSKAPERDNVVEKLKNYTNADDGCKGWFTNESRYTWQVEVTNKENGDVVGEFDLAPGRCFSYVIGGTASTYMSLARRGEQDWHGPQFKVRDNYCWGADVYDFNLPDKWKSVNEDHCIEYQDRDAECRVDRRQDRPYIGVDGENYQTRDWPHFDMVVK
ncbi:MAG TPA: hypothetical protein DCQ04_09620 [Actinobacteria bacterium]|jgi:hypothetical protein|nr:hypothetical protein [Actinomycetota bacterium]